MPDQLKIYARPKLDNARMILGFTGWMDGGDVSIGTIEYLVDKLNAQKLAEIDPQDSCIYSFPGSMEVSSLFRPHTRIKDGLITAFDHPPNTFFFDQKNNLIFLKGREPNFNWTRYAQSIFSLASEFNVTMIYFVGSVAGLVPHTRQARLFGSVSHESLKADFEKYGIRFTNYEGPASISAYLTSLATQRGFGMANIVAEIPPYVQGRNIRCIETVVKKLGTILGVQVNTEELTILGDELEKKLSTIIETRPELLGHIKKLEEDYDRDVFDTEMGDLKDWLEQQGIRLD